MKRYRVSIGSGSAVSGVRPNNLNRLRVSRGGIRR